MCQCQPAGEISFRQLADGATGIEINLPTNRPGTSLPAYLYNAITKKVILTLIPVVDGKSTTRVSKLDNGRAIGYEQLSNYDGYVTVQEFGGDPGLLLAIGDIGTPAPVSNGAGVRAVGSTGVSGTVTYQAAKSGGTYVTVQITSGSIRSSSPVFVRSRSDREIAITSFG